MNDRFKDRASYARNMLEIVRKLKAGNVAVTLVTAPCVSTVNHPEQSKYIDVLGEFADTVRGIADSEGVGLVDAYGATREYLETKVRDFTMDGQYPNGAGKRLMCDAIEDAWGLGKPLAEGDQLAFVPGRPSGRPRTSRPPSPPAEAPGRISPAAIFRSGRMRG